MNRFGILITAGALAFLSNTADAQHAIELQTGVRVKVTRTHGKSLVGSFVGADADSVRVVGEGASPTIRSTAATDIKMIEVSRGRSRAKGGLTKGLMGLAIGGVSGAVLGAATYSDNNSTSCTPNLGCGPTWCMMVCSKRSAAGLAGFLGGAAGLVIGTITGVVSGQEQWNSARLPNQ